MPCYLALHLLEFFSALSSMASIMTCQCIKRNGKNLVDLNLTMKLLTYMSFINHATQPKLSHYTGTVLMLFGGIDFSLLTPDQPFVLWMSFWCTLCCAQIRLKHFCWDPSDSLPSGSVQMAPESICSGSLSFSWSLSVFHLSLFFPPSLFSEGQKLSVHEFRKPQCCFHDYQMSPVTLAIVESSGKWKSESRTEWHTCIFCLFFTHLLHLKVLEVL